MLHSSFTLSITLAEYINSHVFSLFNYNVIESIFVGISVLINLAGIMFDSPYLKPEPNGKYKKLCF